MFNWVCDLLDHRHDVQNEIWQLEQELKSKKKELTQLEVRKQELEASGLSLNPVVTYSVSGLSQDGASAEPSAPKKKKKNKQKGHPGLLSQAKQ